MAAPHGITVRQLRDELDTYIDSEPVAAREELLVKIDGELRTLSTDYLGRRLILRAGLPVQ